MYTRLPCRFVVPLFLLLLPALATATPLTDKVAEHRLANGLRLLMVERHEIKTGQIYFPVFNEVVNAEL